ncbi:hypothetical protein CCP3SC15_1350009 [Gammaproteobacteria bacterium]
MMDGKKHFKDIVLEIKTNFENASEAVFDEISAFIDKLAEHSYVGYALKRTSADGTTEG